MVENCSLVIIAVPAYGPKDVMDQISPHLRDVTYPVAYFLTRHVPKNKQMLLLPRDKMHPYNHWHPINFITIHSTMKSFRSVHCFTLRHFRFLCFAYCFIRQITNQVNNIRIVIFTRQTSLQQQFTAGFFQWSADV